MRRSTLGLWLGMSIVDPFDENRADARAARVAVAAMNGPHWKKIGGEPCEDVDFLPYHALQRDPQELVAQKEREMASRLRAAMINASGHKAKN